MTEELLKIIRKDPRYDGFVLLNEPIPFNQKFKGQNYKRVQIYDTTIIKEDMIVGFFGAFEWKDGMIIPLDYDTYNEEMDVLGYSWTRERPDSLDILVGENW